MKTTRYQPYAWVTILSWGVGNVCTRVALQNFSPFAIGFLRYAIAAVLLAGLALHRRLAPPARRDWVWFLLSGVAGFAFYVVSYNLGYMTVTAATGSVISATVPLMTAALAQWVFCERLRFGQWAAVGLQFCGILVIALANGRLSASAGVGWMLASAVSLSIYNLLQRYLTAQGRYSALQSAVYSIFCGAAMLCVFAPQAVRQLPHAAPAPLASVLFLGLFASVVAFLCWSKALSLAPRASQVSNYMFITPLISTGVEMVWLRELPPASTLAGGGLILLGAVFFRRCTAKGEG